MIVQLKPTAEQRRLLDRTMAESTKCFNAVCQEGFGKGYSNGTELHKATYYPLRGEFPDLPAQLVCSARVKATEAVKSALTWKKKHEAQYPKRVEKAKKQGKEPPMFKPVRCPQFKSAPLRYDARSYWVKWESLTASLATVGGRQEMSFTVPASADRYLGKQVCSADLCFRCGRYFLHIVVSIPAPDVAPSPDVMGVDLGLTRPAVSSHRHFLGERRWKEQERRIFRIKRKLQRTGTRSATRHLKKLSGKLFRQRRDHDHVLSKRIVQHAPDGSTIVIENLKNIRNTSKIGRGKQHKTVDTKRRLHSWTFDQFYGFLSYKAQEHGIEVVKIDPRHTSQTCSRRGYQARNNRRSQSVFHCRSCGYQLNADLNASYNIRDKFCLAQSGTSVLSGPSSSGLSCPSSGEMQAPAL